MLEQIRKIPKRIHRAHDTYVLTIRYGDSTLVPMLSDANNGSAGPNAVVSVVCRYRLWPAGIGRQLLHVSAARPSTAFASEGEMVLPKTTNSATGKDDAAVSTRCKGFMLDQGAYLFRDWRWHGDVKGLSQFHSTSKLLPDSTSYDSSC